MMGKIHEVVDIGCGQGEFVKKLRKINVNAIGFDPALRKPTDFLYRQYFDPGVNHFDHPNIIFVLRCVLPHIHNPFEYLNKIFEVSPDAQV